MPLEQGNGLEVYDRSLGQRFVLSMMLLRVSITVFFLLKHLESQGSYKGWILWVDSSLWQIIIISSDIIVIINERVRNLGWSSFALPSRWRVVVTCVLYGVWWIMLNTVPYVMETIWQEHSRNFEVGGAWVLQLNFDFLRVLYDWTSLCDSLPFHFLWFLDHVDFRYQFLWTFLHNYYE